MVLTRTKKLILTILTSLLYQITTGIGGFILPRLIILHYGSAYNGTLSSITQFLSIVALLRLGVAGALRVSLYNALATKDNEKISGIINGAQAYMHRIGYIIGVYVIILIGVYPLLITNPTSYLATSVLVFALGIGTFAEYFFGMSYGSLLESDQRLYVLNIIQTVTIALNIGISVVLILHGCSIQTVKLVSAVLFFMSPLILNIYVSNVYHIDNQAPPNPNAFAKRKDAMGHSIANIIHENTDIILLTLFCEVKVVSVYAVYALVMTSLRKMLSVLTNGTEASFGNLWARNEYGNIQKYMRCYELLVSSFTVIVFSATGLLLLPFITLYTKGVRDVQYYIPSYAFTITLAYFFYFLRTPYLTIVQAVGHYKETQRGAYAEALINLSISIICIQFLGLVGTALGTLAANMFRTAQYVHYVKQRLLPITTQDIFRRFLWIAGNIAVIFLFCKTYTLRAVATGWYNWCLCGGMIVGIGIIFVFITAWFFYRNDIQILLTIFMHIWTPKKSIQTGK